MTTTINASTTAGLVQTADTSGALALQTAGTTALTINSSQAIGVGSSPSYGTSGQFLTSGGSGSAPTWTTAASSQWTTTGSNIYYSTGNVGINTSTPARKFEVNGAGAVAARVSGTNPVLEFGVNSGTNTNFMLAAQSNVGDAFEITPSTTVGGFTFTTPALIVRSDGQIGMNTTSVYNASRLNLLTPGGYNGIGLSTPSGSNDAVSFYTSTSTFAGRITPSGSSVAYQTSSDYRLKENITPMTGALAKVLQLKPVNFKWKTDGRDGQGFIAHELQAVVPDCVGGTKDAVDADGNPNYQGIDTSFLVATLTAALQETKALIDTQAETITALTARIVALENRA